MRGVRSQGSDTSVQAKCFDLAARNSSKKRSDNSWTACVCKDLSFILDAATAVVVFVVDFVVVVIFVSQFNLFEELEVCLVLFDVFRFCCFRW